MRLARIWNVMLLMLLTASGVAATSLFATYYGKCVVGTELRVNFRMAKDAEPVVKKYVFREAMGGGFAVDTYLGDMED